MTPLNRCSVNPEGQILNHMADKKKKKNHHRIVPTNVSSIRHELFHIHGPVPGDTKAMFILDPCQPLCSTERLCSAYAGLGLLCQQLPVNSHHLLNTLWCHSPHPSLWRWCTPKLPFESIQSACIQLQTSAANCKACFWHLCPAHFVCLEIEIVSRSSAHRPQGVI